MFYQIVNFSHSFLDYNIQEKLMGENDDFSEYLFKTLGKIIIINYLAKMDSLKLIYVHVSKN